MEDKFVRQDVIEDVLYAALSRGGDFAEIFLEDKYNANVKMVGEF